MSARSRKRKVYRQTLRMFPYTDNLLTDLITNGKIEGWDAINADVIQLFGSDFIAARNWFNTPAIGLDMKRPLDLMKAGQLEMVQTYLTRLKHGVYT